MKNSYHNTWRKQMQKERFKNGVCIYCGKNKLAEGKRYCRKCLDNKKKYYKNNKEEILLKQRPYAKERHAKIKIETLSHYSKEGYPKCQICGFEGIKALSLDHIKNGAADRRKSKTKGVQFYQWVIKNNYPEGLQCLCMNCQFTKID